MFDFSFAELLVVVLVALVVIGPEEMPTVARGILKAMRSLRHAYASIRQQLLEVVEDDGLQSLKQDVHQIQGGKRFILDDDGNYREVFDVSDLSALRAEKPQAEGESVQSGKA
jgi:sec-independent protein translocase protein TatB